MNFCDKCKKIVPDNEIHHYDEIEFRGIIPARDCHQYKKMYNQNGSSSGMNFCLGMQTVYCGNIREPSAEEYFIYVTLGIKEDYEEDE